MQSGSMKILQKRLTEKIVGQVTRTRLEMKIELVDLTEDNKKQCFELKVAGNQIRATLTVIAVFAFLHQMDR